MAAATLSQPNTPAEYADAELNRYYSAAMKRLADAGEDFADARTELRNSQRAWIKYRDSECGAVYTYWQPGTVAGDLSQDCLTRLTQARTLSIWSNWLLYVDSTPPILPKPSGPALSPMDRSARATVDGAAAQRLTMVKSAAIVADREDGLSDSGKIAAASIGGSDIYVVYMRTRGHCGSGGCRAQLWTMENGFPERLDLLPVGHLPIVLMDPSEPGTLGLGVTYYDINAGPEGQIVPVTVGTNGVVEWDWDNLKPMSDGVPILTEDYLESF